MGTTVAVPQIEMSPTQDDRLNILLYGLSGAGKTRLALSAREVPELSPVLVLDVERGLIGVPRDGLWSRVRVEGIEQVEGAVSALARKQGDYSKFNTVVLDSGTLLCATVLQKYAAMRAGGQPDEYQREDYGRTLARLTNLFSNLRRLPQHVIVTAGQKFVYAPAKPGVPTPITDVLPRFSGQVFDRVQEMADMVWCLAEQNDRRFLRVRPKMPYRIKSRSLLEEGIDENGLMADPTMAKVWSSFRAALTKNVTMATNGKVAK